MNKNRIVIVVINVIIFIAMMLAMILCLNKLEWYIQVFAYLCIIGFFVGTIVFALLKKDSLMKSCFSLSIVALIIIAIFTAFNLLGVFENFSDSDKVKDLILSYGGAGYIIFALLEILNIVVLPIPALILHLAGVAIFGAWQAFLISYISVLIGSFISFFIGRIFGKRVVEWCIGKELTEKYSKVLGDRGYFAFILMQILPFFPDDILCMVAGLSSMKLLHFTIAMVLIRPIYIATVCFFGTGSVIPFSGWGIPVWIAIFVVLTIVFVLYCVNHKKIEAWFETKFKSKSKNKESSN